MKLCLLFPGTRDLISNNNKENTVYHFHLRFLPLSLRRWIGCMLLSQSHYALRLSTFQPSFHKSRESWSGRGIALERERERKRRSRFREDSIQGERDDGLSKVLTRIDDDSLFTGRLESGGGCSRFPFRSSESSYFSLPFSIRVLSDWLFR